MTNGTADPIFNIRELLASKKAKIVSEKGVMNDRKHGTHRPRPARPMPKLLLLLVISTAPILVGCRTFAHNLCAAESEVRSEIDAFRGELQEQLGPILGGGSNLLLYLPFTAAKFTLRIACIGLGEAASAVSVPFEAVGISDAGSLPAGHSPASPLPPVPDR